MTSQEVFEAWWEAQGYVPFPDEERSNSYHLFRHWVGKAWDAATAAEREQAAKIAEEYDPHTGTPGYDTAITKSIAAAIRAEP